MYHLLQTTLISNDKIKLERIRSFSSIKDECIALLQKGNAPLATTLSTHINLDSLKIVNLTDNLFLFNTNKDEF